jgi:hypothetical protein
MLDFEIELPGKEGTFKHPITITEKDLLISLLEKKGKAIDLIKSLLIELKKDDSDIVQMNLRELHLFINNNFDFKCNHKYIEDVTMGVNIIVCKKCGDII